MRFVSNLFVGCVGLLLALGLVMLYSAGMKPGASAGQERFLVTQLIWCGVAFVPCAVAASMDYGKFRQWAWAFLAVSALLLMAVLVPAFSDRINGSRRWLDLGFGRFQPSETAKFALVLALAAYAARSEAEMKSFRKGLLIPALFISPILLLIYVEPDRGTTALLAVVSGVMLIIAGVRWLHLLPPAAAMIGGFAWLLLSDPMRRARILSWMDLEGSKQGVGFQGWQALVALGSGGWTGRGLGNGRQKLGFIPEHQTDFIFSVIGEELGLIATLAVILVFMLLLFCGLFIAWNARDQFGFVLGSGITFLIGLQAFINMGVVTGLLPNKGLPLPFISYGGSNLVVMMTCAGFLFSIARHAEPRADWDHGPENIFSASPGVQT